MKSAPIPKNEKDRLKDLKSLNLLDTPQDQSFDSLTTLGAEIAQTPIALISLVDENRQWFKSCIGLSTKETPRDIAFCSHAILNDQPLIINDTLEDPRFYNNPLVIDGPKIRFYIGFPLKSPPGSNLGTLCLIDTKPRQLTTLQIKNLSLLANQAEELISHKHTLNLLKESTQDKEKLFNYIIHDIKTPLSVINLNLEMLETLDPIEESELIQQITKASLNSCKDLNSIIHKTLENNKDMIKSHYKIINPSTFLDQLIKKLNPLVKSNQFIVNKTNINNAISINDIMLERVITNLISNAIKYSPTNSTITLYSEIENNILNIKVIDEGAGIPEEVQKGIFNETIDKKNTDSSHLSSHGIGLSACDMYTKLLNGTLTVENNYPSGSIFKLSCPIITEESIKDIA